MKFKLALAAAAIVGAFAITAPSNAAPLAGAGAATQSAKVDAKLTEEVRHRRHWRHRHWRHRHWRHRHGYRRHWRRPYYGYAPYYYRPFYGYGHPYYYRRRPAFYFGFGF